jgi:predicted nucleic acid-binding protein
MNWIDDGSEVYFDNDCMASFLWIRRLDIIEKILGARVMVPSMVMKEFMKLRFTPSRYVYDDIKLYVDTHPGTLQSATTAEEVKTFSDLVTGRPRLGRGEAEAYSLALHSSGVVASNNRSDLASLCEATGVTLIGTQHILVAGYDLGLISESQGEQIWNDMISKRRWLPSYGFAGAIKRWSRRATS